MTNRDLKLGLALSGGGFRAALFHVGVLAALAERDLLRRVEVISTVSGGSVIGAFYHLKVKQLLERQRQDDLEPDARGFVRLVQEVEVEFLEAVQANIRTRVFANQSDNARMLRDDYSSSERFAALFGQHFFSRAGGGGPAIPLHQSLIVPPGLASDGEDRRAILAALSAHNREHDTRIPLLILNATSLNSGNLFQFSGAFVGEPPRGELGSAPDLERLYFDDPALKPAQRDALRSITLGEAATASCCVPGLFEPIRLQGLHRSEDGRDHNILLVDGGVYDNQGLSTLLSQGCTHAVCSDASDILRTETAPSGRSLNAAMRANDILMDRVRSQILSKLDGDSMKSMAVFQLGDCQEEPGWASADAGVTERLARIRTDLDSFSDLEAGTLMLHGYTLAGARLAEGDDPDGRRETYSPDWRFQQVEAHLEDPELREALLAQLDVGARQFFKVFYMGRRLPYVILLAPVALPVLALLGLLWLLPPLPWWVWAGVALVALSGVAYSQNARINQWIDRVPLLARWRRRLGAVLAPVGVPALIGLITATVVQIHLRIFDRLFLYYGGLDTARGRRGDPLRALLKPERQPALTAGQRDSGKH